MHDYGSDAETTKQSDDKTCLLLEKFLHGVIAWDALPMLIPTLMRKKKFKKTPNTSETHPRYRLSRNQSHRRVSNYRDHLIILTFPWCGGRNSLEAHLRHSKYLNTIQKWKLQRLSDRGPSGKPADLAIVLVSLHNRTENCYPFLFGVLKKKLHLFRKPFQILKRMKLTLFKVVQHRPEMDKVEFLANTS